MHGLWAQRDGRKGGDQGTVQASRQSQHHRFMPSLSHVPRNTACQRVHQFIQGIGFRVAFQTAPVQSRHAGLPTGVQSSERSVGFGDHHPAIEEQFVVRAELAGQFDTGALRRMLIIGADDDRFDNDQLILRFRSGSIGGRDIADLDPAEFLLIDAFDPIYGQYPTPQPSPNTDRNEVLEGIGIYL